MLNNAIFSKVTRKQKDRINNIEAFLCRNNLTLDPNVDCFITLSINDDILACGGLDEGIIKCVAISPTLRGEGVLLKLVTELIYLAHENGHSSLYVYTKAENEHLFLQCGFYTLATVPGVMVLMENSATRLKNYLRQLRALRRPGNKIGAIVMNANPFTNGHRHLIRHAASQCDWLHLFLVREDCFEFPWQDRLELVREATRDMANLTLHPGSAYTLSRATFPAYFLKDKALVDTCYTALDITLFRQHLAPVLGITHRFVGSEPICKVTARYNQDMRHWLVTDALPFDPIALIEIPRLLWHGVPISASRVRQLLRQQDLSAIAPLVPEATQRYLQRRLNIAAMAESQTQITH